jgi:hypothetical protein
VKFKLFASAVVWLMAGTVITFIWLVWPDTE